MYVSIIYIQRHWDISKQKSTTECNINKCPPAEEEEVLPPVIRLISEDDLPPVSVHILLSTGHHPGPEPKPENLPFLEMNCPTPG